MNRINWPRLNTKRTQVNPGKQRRGFTLIELLLVLVLTASLLGGTIGLISIAGVSNQHAKQNQRLRQEIRRFADDFRRDMRLAEQCVLANSEVVLQDTSASLQIRYTIESESGIIRRVHKNETAQESIDHYQFLGCDRIEVQPIGQAEPANPVQWTISQSNRSMEPIRIIAAHRSAR